MRKKTIFWFVCFLILILANITIAIHYMNKERKLASATRILDEIDSGYQYISTSQNEGIQEDVERGDVRIANLKYFFRKYNSPLYEEAETIVKTSDKYAFDYRLLPAIAMQESGLCRVIPPDSHNCWGWGIYGDTITRFASYPDAIETVSQGIRKNYLDKGLVTASQIMEKYTPSSNGSWAHGVNTFIQALEQ